MDGTHRRRSLHRGDSSDFMRVGNLAYQTFRRALTIVLVTGLATGCGLRLSTSTVQPSDTYGLWEDRLDRMPFLFHFPDGHIEAFDDHGGALTEAGDTSGVDSGRRVEVYIGGFPSSAGSLCGAPVVHLSPGTEPGGANVVSALCDRSRTVVSFSDHVRPRVLAATRSYVPRVRHLLLEGIWESVAQEPEPLHE